MMRTCPLQRRINLNFQAEATKANVKRLQSVQDSEGVISESSRLFSVQQESGLVDGLSAGFEREEREKKTKRNGVQTDL